MPWVRVTVLRVELDTVSGPKPEEMKSFADPILGARMGVRFGPERRWSWRMRGDLGGFGAGSDFTWNAVGMLGYDFRAKVPVTVALGVCTLSQDYDDGSGLKYFRWDVTQYGPVFVLSFPF